MNEEGVCETFEELTYSFLNSPNYTSRAGEKVIENQLDYAFESREVAELVFEHEDSGWPVYFSDDTIASNGDVIRGTSGTVCDELFHVDGKGVLRESLERRYDSIAESVDSDYILGVGDRNPLVFEVPYDADSEDISVFVDSLDDAITRINEVHDEVLEVIDPER